MTTTITLDSLESTATAELLAFYNERTGKRTTKFASRAKGIEQVRALLLAEPAQAEPAASSEQVCPKCGSTELYAGRADKHGTVTDEDYITGCHHCDWRVDSRAPRAAADPKRSAAIAATWADVAVREARATRHAVTVSGFGSYKSVRAAFAALVLPMSKHIRFRGELKAAGAADFVWEGTTYHFTATEL